VRVCCQLVSPFDTAVCFSLKVLSVPRQLHDISVLTAACIYVLFCFLGFSNSLIMNAVCYCHSLIQYVKNEVGDVCNIISRCVSVTIVNSTKAISTNIKCSAASVALVIQQAECMLSVILSYVACLAVPFFFPHYLINSTIFRRKVTEPKMF
jgi:hypothetical protein